MRYILGLLAAVAGFWIFFFVLPGEIRTATFFLIGFFAVAAALYKIAHAIETMDSNVHSKLNSQPRVSTIQI